MTMAIVVFSMFFNTVGAKHLPLFESMILFLHIFGFFAVLIPLWVLAPKAPAKQVFTEFSNFGGWSSIGTACLVGQLTATGEYIKKLIPMVITDGWLRLSRWQRLASAFG